MKKFAAGKVIGLQNLIPAFQEKTEIVHFTDNLMVAELSEVDIDKLRNIINEDAQALKALWNNLLPSALLLLFNQKALSTPKFIAVKPWREVAKLAERYSDLKVLDEGEKFNLPAGGFLLQGKVK